MHKEEFSIDNISSLFFIKRSYNFSSHKDLNLIVSLTFFVNYLFYLFIRIFIQF